MLAILATNFDTWEDNLIWVSSLRTFNHIVIEGINLPSTGRLYLVDDEGAYTYISAAEFTRNTEATELTVAWDWDKIYASYNSDRPITFGSGALGGQGFRGFIWIHGPDPIPLPAAPANFAGSADGRISWSAVEDATSYEHRYKVASANDNTYSAWTETTNLYAEIANLTNDTEYTAQVRSKNSLGVSANPAQVFLHAGVSNVDN